MWPPDEGPTHQNCDIVDGWMEFLHGHLPKFDMLPNIELTSSSGAINWGAVDLKFGFRKVESVDRLRPQRKRHACLTHDKLTDLASG